MPTPTEIREALAEALDGRIDGLSVVARRPSPSIPLPAVWVQPSTANFQVPTDRRGLDTWEFSLIVAVSMADVDVAQRNLDELLAKTGDRSIRALIKADPHLGLSPQTVAWVDRMVYGTDPFPGSGQQVNALAATLYVHVRTDG